MGVLCETCDLPAEMHHVGAAHTYRPPTPPRVMADLLELAARIRRANLDTTRLRMAVTAEEFAQMRKYAARCVGNIEEKDARVKETAIYGIRVVVDG